VQFWCVFPVINREILFSISRRKNSIAFLWLEPRRYPVSKPIPNDDPETSAMKRWAKKKRAEKAAAKKAATVVQLAKAAPVAKGARNPMSAATKKKLALAAKARWTAKKAPAKTAAKKAAPVATAAVKEAAKA
jgi:hypothetical protein